jgi:hypothetical protein
MASATIEKKPTSKRRYSPALIVGAFVGAFAVGAGAAPAIAGSVNSAFGYYTVASVQYRNMANIATGPGAALAGSYATGESTSVPAGRAGARGRLYYDSGTIACEGSNTYNASTLPQGHYVAGFSCTRTTAGLAWYSYGVTLAFNGSGYNSVYTFRTVSQNS